MSKTNGSTSAPSNRPKSYSRFSLADVKALGIEVRTGRLFSNVPPIAPSDRLQEALEDDPVIATGSEASKSIFTIGPVIKEMTKTNQEKMTIFPGYTFDVDPDKGLVGSCDFIFSKVPRTLTVEAPVFFLVEAKNENLQIGAAQVIAEMYAAKLFNHAAKRPEKPIYGVVTWGQQWQFYQLAGNMVTQDRKIFTLDNLPQILGVLQHIIDNA